MKYGNTKGFTDTHQRELIMGAVEHHNKIKGIGRPKIEAEQFYKTAIAVFYKTPFYTKRKNGQKIYLDPKKFCPILKSFKERNGYHKTFVSTLRYVCFFAKENPGREIFLTPQSVKFFVREAKNARKPE